MLKREEVLQNKLIKVVAVKRQRNFIQDPKHDGHFMYTRCLRSYSVPMKASGGLLPILTKDEQEFFEKELNLAEGTLTFHTKGKASFWDQKNFHVDVDKEGMTLDLSDAMDNLRYRVLKANPEIAPSWDERLDSFYWFALVDQDYEDEEESRKTILKLTVADHFNKIKNSPTKMRNFLRVYGKKAPANASLEWMVGQIGMLMDSTVDVLEKMKLVFEDKTFEMKLFIEKALDCQAIIKQGNNYKLHGGDVLGVGMEATVAALTKHKAEQDAIYTTIAAKVELYESGIK